LYQWSLARRRKKVEHGGRTLNGRFKPIIGLAFALFVYGLLNAGLVVVNIPETSTARSFFLVVAFLAGFSERLAPNLAQRAESALTATK
jgi:hypothetical protein